MAPSLRNLAVVHSPSLTIEHEIEMSVAGQWEGRPAVAHVSALHTETLRLYPEQRDARGTVSAEEDETWEPAYKKTTTEICTDLFSTMRWGTASWHL